MRLFPLASIWAAKEPVAPDGSVSPCDSERLLRDVGELREFLDRIDETAGVDIPDPEAV